MEGDVLFINNSVKNLAKCIFKSIIEKILLKPNIKLDSKYLKSNEKFFSYAINKIFNNDKTIIIAISGESGSGKSVISHEISALFRKYGICAKCLCADNFYKIPPKERNTWRNKHKNQIGINEYNWNLINKITNDFRKRRISSFQIIDLNTQEPEILTTNFSKINVIILDGLFIISNKLKDADFRIFLTAPNERKIKAQKTRGKEDTNNSFRKFIINKENNDVKNLCSQLVSKKILFVDGINKTNCLKKSLIWKTGKEVYQTIKDMA